MIKNKPWGLQWRSRSLFIVTTIALGLFTDLFLYGLPVPLLPYILKDRLKLPARKIQSCSSSLLAAHAISSVVFCPFAGLLSDKCSGRKMPYLAGVLILLLATIMLFLGGNMATLVIARVLQGGSGALVWTVGQAILVDTVGAKNVGKATGTINGTISIGALAAPVLGGILYHKTGVVGPLSLACSLLGVDLLMRLLVVEKKAAARFDLESRDEDFAGRRRVSGEGDAEEGAENPLLKQPQDPAYAIPPGQCWMIQSHPLLYCFKDTRMQTSIWITLIQATLMGSLDATVPTVGEAYYGFTSLQTGLLFIPVVLPGLIFTPIAGCITDRKGPRAIVTWGYALLVPTFASLRMVHPGGLDQILTYCLLLTLCGTCLAATNPPAMVEPTLVAEKYHKANPETFGPNGPYVQIASVIGLVYNAGTALGPLLAGALKNTVGYGNMNLVNAALALATALLGYMYAGEKSVD